MDDIENIDQNIKSTRVLKIAIFIMTLLLIIGFCVVFITIGHRLSNDTLNNEEVAPLNNKIAIESSQDIISVTSDGKSLIITTTDVTGSYIIYNIDKKTNKIISTIKFDK
ncbi:MAG: hypothetical protein CML88_02715 [Rhodobiaceae bacterium]|nr:hypothetical protein [Rhodobiaceae bacterium]|tara:strand:+ start:3651 stop:3980 length:330 start_codon:yes stop_codon:yes gene_type:complete